MALLKLKNVSKSFEKDKWVIPDFNLEINDGEFLVLVGPSGCGKSTMLRIIAGLEDPTKGEVYIGDSLVNEVPPKDRDIAMVFQNYALYPHMNVYDNLAFGLKLRKKSKQEIKQQVDLTAKILDIIELLKRKPKELSGGQRQRVALGRAIVRNPQVFLFDEPLSNLDAKLRVQMRAEIKKLHRQIKTTMIYVTHDQVEAMTMGDRIVIMKSGIIQQVGSPLEVYHDPTNVFVASFIGSPAMNLIEGKIENGKFIHNGLRLDLPDSPVIPKIEGFSVVLGVRPDDLKVTQDKEGLEFPVSFSEPLGNEIILHLKCGDKILLAKVYALDSRKIGDYVTIRIDPNRCYLFQQSTGERIKLG